MRHEIHIDLSLTDEQRFRLEFHSILNAVNILRSELEMMRMVMADPLALERSLNLCDSLLLAFQHIGMPKETLREVEQAHSIILLEVQKALAFNKLRPEDEPHVLASLENMRSILAVVEARVREMFARQGAPSPWRLYTPGEIVSGLKLFLDAVGKNSRGQFRIVYQKEDQTEHDYFVDIRVENSARGGGICLPSAFLDSLRDLTANARKYSAPGTRIGVSLAQDADGVCLEVRDAGRGIPPGEIDEVVHFGVRGSNVRPDETRGGGFGLTKAYCVCKQFGGRMWIETELDAGTAVVLHIPIQSAVQRAECAG